MVNGELNKAFTEHRWRRSSSNEDQNKRRKMLFMVSSEKSCW
jgi:hypothetical protein